MRFSVNPRARVAGERPSDKVGSPNRLLELHAKVRLTIAALDIDK